MCRSDEKQGHRLPALAALAICPSEELPSSDAPASEHKSLPSSWRSGDIAKVLVVVGCLTFLLSIALHDFGLIHVFSPSYLANGFCISNPEAHPAVQSHAISFYADVITSALMGALILLGPYLAMCPAALSPIRKNAYSLLGHGCGHLYLALQTDREHGATQIFESLSPHARCVAFVAFTTVWYGFMRDDRRRVTTALGLALAHNTLQIFFLPTRFFFTHVLMAVLINSAVQWLKRPPDDPRASVYYDLEAWLVDVPIVLASFGEACTCDSFLVRYGGHVWFDMVVPVMFVVYFAVLLLTGWGTLDGSVHRCPDWSRRQAMGLATCGSGPPKERSL